jgi:chemotaxis protein MotB
MRKPGRTVVLRALVATMIDGCRCTLHAWEVEIVEDRSGRIQPARGPLVILARPLLDVRRMTFQELHLSGPSARAMTFRCYNSLRRGSRSYDFLTRRRIVTTSTTCPRRSQLALALVLVAATSACVTTGTFDKKVAELDKERGDHDRAAAEREKALKTEVQDLQAQIKEDEGTIVRLTTEKNDLQKRLDDTTALAGELKTRLEKLGQNVDKLTSEKGQLAQVLEDAKARLEDLRRQKAAAEARATTFRDLVKRLRSMIDAGRLKVVIRDGRMLIALPNDVLFDSGKTSIKPDGQAALAEVARVLATIPDRHFLVAGETDDVPIHTSRFPSNWELSTARAVEVTKFLIANGMRPQVLAAAGYGEFDPVAANDSPEHKAQNRRIEIVLQPNLADLPSLDDVAR